MEKRRHVGEERVKKMGSRERTFPDGSAMAIAIIGCAIIGKVGDAVGLALIDSYPLTLLMLNANDLHCALTSTSVAIVPWFVVSTARRMCEDPLYFWIGRRYRERALLWLRRTYPGAASALESGEAHFRRGSYAAIVINPGMVVCSLAGASQVRPTTYLVLNLLGVLIRLVLIRSLCAMFPEKIDFALDLIRRYLPILLLVAVAFSVTSAYKLYGHSKKKAHA